MKKVLILLACSLMLSTVSFSGSPVDDVGDNTEVTINDSNYDYSYDVTVPVTGEYTTSVSESITTTVISYGIDVIINPVTKLYDYDDLSLTEFHTTITSNYTKEATPNHAHTRGGYNMLCFC